MGRQRRAQYRPLNGILLLDKPLGLSSNQALQLVKRLYNAQKAGHTGSLDPLATGMLPICFGESTKVSAFLLDSDKTYTLECSLGVTTVTGDAEGDVVSKKPVPTLSNSDIKHILQGFEGDIEQIPPMYSAIKHNGERLYNLARQGIEVERQARPIKIYQIEMLAFANDLLSLRVFCSKGTYIRTLVEDIGSVIGCGAHVSKLSRERVAPYTAADPQHTLADLEQIATQGYPALDNCLLPTQSAVSQWPDVYLTRDSAYYLGRGQAVQVPQAPTRGFVRLFSENKTFLGMGQIQDDGKVAPKRLFL